MPQRRKRTQTSRNTFTNFMGPITIGTGYAVSKILLIRWLIPEATPHIDFKLFLLAGFLLGIIISPIFRRIFWYRLTSFFTITFSLLLMGYLGNFPEQLMWGNELDSLFWTMALIESIPIVVVTFIASVILLPSQTHLTLPMMYRRLKRLVTWEGAVKTIVGAAVYVVVFLVFRAAFYSLDAWNTPLENLQQFFLVGPSMENKLFYLWLRGCLLILAILPIHNVIQGKPIELTMIFSLLLFVVNDFVALFAPIHGQLPQEMIDQIIQRLFIDVFFCYTMMLLFGRSSISQPSGTNTTSNNFY